MPFMTCIRFRSASVIVLTVALGALYLVSACGGSSSGGPGVPIGDAGDAGGESDSHATSGETVSCSPLGSVCSIATPCCQGLCSVETGQTSATCQ
jgi:hypothetical protein